MHSKKKIRGPIKNHMEMVTYAPFFCLDKNMMELAVAEYVTKNMESGTCLHCKKHLDKEPELRTLISKTKYGT